MITFKIGQVAKMLSVKVHTLRYWEARVPLLRPSKNAEGWREYNESNLRMLFRFRHLVVNRCFTVKGAYQQLLCESEKKDIRYESLRSNLIQLYTRNKKNISKINKLLTFYDTQQDKQSIERLKGAVSITLPPLKTKHHSIQILPIVETPHMIEDILSYACALALLGDMNNMEEEIRQAIECMRNITTQMTTSISFLFLVQYSLYPYVINLVQKIYFQDLPCPTILPVYPLYTHKSYRIISPIMEYLLAVQSWCKSYPHVAYLSILINKNLPINIRKLFYTHRLKNCQISFFSRKITKHIYRLYRTMVVKTQFLTHIGSLFSYGKWKLNSYGKLYEHESRVCSCFECFQSDIAYCNEVNIFSEHV